MKVTLLDVAFRIRIDHKIPSDPLHPYIDPEQARIHALKSRFPALDPQVVEDAYRQANHMLDVAIEMADLQRGPKNDHTGPPFDVNKLSERCPGFCEETYQNALGEAFMLTR